MEIEYALKSYGLTDKEINVYLKLLPLGQVSLQEISKKLPYPRSTVYHTLSYLMTKGLVATITKGSIRFYQATDPQKLKEELKEKEKLIESVLPMLTELKSQTVTPSSVEIYEGFEGIHTILADLTKVKQQVYYFGGYKKSLEKLKHLPDYVRRARIEKGIPAKMIYDATDESILHTKKYQKISELRFNKSMEDFPAMFFIYGEKVSMFSHKTDLVGIIIKNKDLADAMKIIFNMYWEHSKPVKYN